MQTHTAGRGRIMPTYAVVGSGSAGQRHLAALTQLHPQSKVVLVRRATSTALFDPAAWPEVTVVSSIDDIDVARLRLAVVASPATFHRTHAEQLLSGGVDTLIEKPLAASSADAKAIVSCAALAGRQVIVGYHLRWSEPARQFQRLVADGAVGTPQSFELKVGQHLSQWRPGTDPRSSVTAQQELGGGVLLELSHEIDAVRWILGDVRTVTCQLRYDGAPTDGLVDTAADLDLALVCGAVGHVHLDMTSNESFRRWTVSGTDATVSLNLLTGEITRTGLDGTIAQVRQGTGAGRECAELRLIAHALDVSAGAAQPLCTGADGVAALDIIEAARASAAEGRPMVISAPSTGGAR